MAAADSSCRTGITLDRVLDNPADSHAWERFVNRYGRRIHQWCRKYGAQDADAADITQEVLLRFHQRMRSYDRARPFRNWLKTVTHHAWHDFVDKHSSANQGAGGSSALQRIHSVEAREELLTRINEAYDLDLLEAAQAQVQQEVSADHWQCFCAMSLERGSAAAVGKITGMSQDAVWQANSRVKKRLAEVVQQLESPVTT